MKITDKAKEKIIDVMYNEGTSYMRFGLQGSGCAGMQYYFDVATDKDADDIEFRLNEDLALIIDPMSNMYLDEAEIDFKTSLMGESFVFNNPLHKTSCGCGSSVAFD